MKNEPSRAAIVTGGAQGIGKAITERLLQDGLRVLIADHDEEACREAQTELSGIGEVEYSICDVSDEDDVRRTVLSALEHFGRLDVLVNNAGIGGPKVGRALGTDYF